MDEDLDEVLALKASAKSARADADWEGASGDLDEAVGILGGLLPDPPGPVPSRVASELADVYGIMGGIERRWGLSVAGEERERHLEKSVAAYDEGFQYERDLDPSEATTYNRINRLIGRVLIEPQLLAEVGTTAPDLERDLMEAERILAEQVASARQKDPWGYCDLGTVRLLLGTTDALQTFRQLERLRPPGFVYESVLSTLEPLAQVASYLRPDLAQAVALLRRAAEYGLE